MSVALCVPVNGHALRDAQSGEDERGRRVVQVTMASGRAVPHTAATLPRRTIDALVAALSSSCTDSWRLQLLGAAATAGRITCAHAARLLRCFEGADSAAAVLLLLRAIPDAAAVTTLEAAAVPEELHAAWRALGVRPEICSANPCGHYRLYPSLQACRGSHCARAHSLPLAALCAA